MEAELFSFQLHIENYSYSLFCGRFVNDFDMYICEPCEVNTLVSLATASALLIWYQPLGG